MARVTSLFLGFLLTLVLVPFDSERTVVTAAVQGRVTIVGSVVDGSLTPLAGVKITLENGSRVIASTATGADGTFTLAGIAHGAYRVRAERSGFSTLAREVHVPASVTRLKLPLVLLKPSDAITPAQTRESAPSRNVSPPPVGGPPPPPLTPPPPPPPPAHTTSTAVHPAAGRGGPMGQAAAPGIAGDALWLPRPPRSNERYGHVEQNRFKATREQPLSTFGADVDTASYANVRRMLSTGQLPPADAVRVEEFINYFRFNYAEVRDNRPIALTTEIGDCPWAPTHKLVLIGARAKRTAPSEEGPSTSLRPGRNIVLLIDVSGSMAPPERLPLLRTAFAQFVDTLRPDDRIAIVTYAGYSGLALPSTPVRERATIHRAIAGLGAGGSTNGASGIILAYRIAREAFIPGGVNRVVLATDGDFNVGVTSQHDLIALIERERESGVFLSVLGVGSGNLNDAMMEQLADRGNGNYSYLDSLQEARRVLVREGDSTLETVANDVKFQVEFNPAQVAGWKLIGYENRLLAAKDFNDDRKDAGEMGAGHTVTVLYEVVPTGSPDAREWLTVKVRYKAPDDDRSELMERPVRAGGAVQHVPFAAAVAEFGLLLRDNARNERAWDALLRRVTALEVPRALAADKDGFNELVAIAAGLSKRR